MRAQLSACALGLQSKHVDMNALQGQESCSAALEHINQPSSEFQDLAATTHGLLF